MATTKRVFTLRLTDEVFDKIGALATAEHRSMTNYIEYVLLRHIEEAEQAAAPPKTKPQNDAKRRRNPGGAFLRIKLGFSELLAP